MCRRCRARRRNRQLAAGAAALAVVMAATAAHTHHHRPPAGPGPTSAPAASNVALGRDLAAGDGWGRGAQWRCLDALWTRESRWSSTAENPRSGAYGIAQALGHGPTNQYPAGPANPPRSDAAAQIRWGLGYIRATYGSPCAAWAHEETAGWY